MNDAVAAPAISASNLLKTCRMGEVVVQALPGVSFELRRGEMVVLLGPSGSDYPSQLSGVEQQWVAIARAVVKRPEILLCAEPTGRSLLKLGRAERDVAV